MSIAVSIRARHKVVTPAAILWEQSIDAGPIDEGASFAWGIGVNLNGVTPGAGQIEYIDWRITTEAEFAAAFVGETQAIVAAGDFTEGFTALIDTLAASKGWSSTPLESPYAGRRIGIPLDGAAPTLSGTITRVTVERSGDNGSRRFAGIIANPSLGSITGGHVTRSIVIEDISVAPGGGELAAIELDNYFADRLGVGLTPAADTVIGSFVFKDDAAVVLTPGADALTFLTGGDADGRFAIFDAGSGSDRYKLRHTAVVADFEDTPAPRPRLSYPISVSGTVAGITVQASLKILPRNQLIDPAGNETAGETVCSTADEFKAAFAGTVTDKTISFGPTIEGVLTQTVGGQIKMTGDRITVIGDRHVVYKNPNGVMNVTDARDVRIEGLAVGPGAPATVDEQDAVQNWSGGISGGASGDIQRVIWANCVVFAANDELWRVTGTGKIKAPRGVRLTRSLLVYPFYDANHPKGAQHNHGIAASDLADHTMIDHCIIWGADTRDPQINGSCGNYVVNNIFGFWKTNQRGTAILGGRGTLAENTGPSSSIIAGNLYVPREAAARARAIWFYRVQKNATHHYVSDDNHFVNPATDTFTDDPLTTSDGIAHQECSDASVLQTAPGFAVAGLTRDPTTLEADRRALFDDLTTGANRVGNNSAFCDWILANQVRAGVASENVTPAQFEGFYGAAWDGAGGSRGHGVFDPI